MVPGSLVQQYERDAFAVQEVVTAWAFDHAAAEMRWQLISRFVSIAGSLRAWSRRIAANAAARSLCTVVADRVPGATVIQFQLAMDRVYGPDWHAASSKASHPA